VIQTDNRDRLIDYLAEQSVQALIHYPIPAHLQKAYAYLNYKPGSLPNTEKATQRIVSLPMYPELTNDEIDYVIESIRSYFTSSSQEKQNTESPLNAGTQSYEVAAKSGSIS
jgi:dTDP-4-amino-4,6-dideoxygalactose transaminase